MPDCHWETLRQEILYRWMFYWPQTAANLLRSGSPLRTLRQADRECWNMRHGVRNVPARFPARFPAQCGLRNTADLTARRRFRAGGFPRLRYALRWWACRLRYAR